MHFLAFPDCFQALVIGGRDSFIPVNPWSPEQQVIGGLGIHHMETVCCSNRAYSEIQADGADRVCPAPIEAGYFKRLLLNFLARDAKILQNI